MQHIIAGLAAAVLTATAAPAAESAPQVTPRIVVQAMLSGVEVAAWSPDSRFIYTAMGLMRELQVWDVATGVLIDRVRLPAGQESLAEFMFLDSMRWSPDGSKLLVAGVTTNLIDGKRSGRLYRVDVRTRAVTIEASPSLPPLNAGDTVDMVRKRRVGALGIIYEGGNAMSLADADRTLPPLPASPDGRWQIVRKPPGIALKGKDGQVRPMTVSADFVSIIDGALAADNRRLALLMSRGELDEAGKRMSRVEIFDTATGQFGTSVRVKGRFDQLRWTGANELLLMPADSNSDPRGRAAKGMPSPLTRVAADTGAVIATDEARCWVVPLPNGDLVGAGLGNCRSDVPDQRGLYRLTGGQWHELPNFRTPEGADIRAVAASPRGDRLAVVTRLANDDYRLAAVDAATGTVTNELLFRKYNTVSSATFSDDGRRVWISQNTGVGEWLPDAPPGPDAKPVFRQLDAKSLWPTKMVSDGRELLISGIIEDRIVRAEMPSGKALPPIEFNNVVSAGFIGNRSLRWAVSLTGEIRVWQGDKLLMSTVLLPDRHFVTVAADGRYDTNLGPDSAMFRWFVPDAPFQSLAPQTFMRDYYEPQLVRKLMDCTAAGSCAQVLRPVPPVAGLNRQLPEVRITDIRPADTPGQVVVTVAARETRDAGTGRRSGLFNVKLLLDNRQIDQDPPHFQQQPSPTLAKWREINRIEDVDAAGSWSHQFQVPVPTHGAGKPMEFAAYAFNSDRVKSDTARRRWTPPATTVPPRPRRAWVLTIGVDDYAEDRLDLNFAVSDARVIAGRLAAIPGYEMRHISLTSAPAAGGKPARQVTRADVLGVLGFLSGFPPEMDEVIRLEDVHMLRNLEETTPDDIVIISFSGHGFANASGQFALLPSDARWPATAVAPEAKSVISAEDLTIWLGFMQASEIAFIIDACHSGAAVATPDFKPGPMGDASLGQLAYDKGLRILAATQADDVALESANLKQGLLTAALGEGLTDAGGPADLDRDGRIQLDEWLRYAVRRLPSLDDEVRRGAGPMMARGFTITQRSLAGATARVQEPSLFDFNPAASPVVLRGKP